MAEIIQECVEQSPKYKKLLGMFLRQRRKIRSMQKSAGMRILFQEECDFCLEHLTVSHF